MRLSLHAHYHLPAGAWKEEKMLSPRPPNRCQRQNNRIGTIDHTRCNVWILDGDLYHKGLLKFAVSAESLPETLVIFVADMSRPWTVMESLQKWASVLREHIDKMKIPPEEMRELERKCK